MKIQCGNINVEISVQKCLKNLDINFDETNTTLIKPYTRMVGQLNWKRFEDASP